jgi:membrane-associated phospholipid phosphatase
MRAMRAFAPYIQNAVILIMGFFLCLTTSVESRASDGVETAGNVLQVVLPVTAVGLAIGYKDYQGVLQFGESAAVTLGVTYMLKYMVSERRPNGGDHSFPSGGSSISFSAAEFIRNRYGWAYGIPAYATASFVAYSRVEAQQHHAYDVIAGAGIGILSSYLFTKPYKGWNAQAETDGKYYGLKLSRAW